MFNCVYGGRKVLTPRSTQATGGTAKANPFPLPWHPVTPVCALRTVAGGSHQPYLMLKRGYNGQWPFFSFKLVMYKLEIPSREVPPALARTSPAPTPASPQSCSQTLMSLSTSPSYSFCLAYPHSYQYHTGSAGCHGDLYLKCGFVVLCSEQLTSPPVNDATIFHLYPNMDHKGIKINNGAVKQGLGFAVWHTCTPCAP